MEVYIKLEPDNCYDSDTLSCEFLDEKPSELSTPKESETYMMDRSSGQIVHNGKAQSQLEESAAEYKANELSCHTRQMLLKAFQREGCSQETINNYFKTYSFNVDVATEYFDNVAKDAQDYVYQECDSLSFNNITEWLKYFKSTGRQEQCNYEAAIVLNAIANNEIHPEPILMDGVDLKAIYKFLSNSLMGLPQEQLDKESATFLSNEFQNLIDEANTDEADNDVRIMKIKIEKSLLQTVDEKKYDLDPLNTNSEELKKYYVNVKKENI